MRTSSVRRRREHDFRQLDVAFDDGAVAIAQRADRHDARAVLVAQWQMEQHVLHRVQAELRQQLGERRPDAAQRRDGTFGEQGGRAHAGVERCGLQDQDSVHFHHRSARQRGHADRSAGRIGLREIFGHHLVDRLEVAEVGQVDVELHRVRQVATGGFRDGLQVVEHTPHVHFDFAGHDFHGFRIKRNLTREVTVLPALTAWLYVPIAPGASGVVTAFRGTAISGKGEEGQEGPEGTA